MDVITYGVPILGVIGSLGAAYTVFAGILKPEKMGVEVNVLKMFGVGELIMGICWALVIYFLRSETDRAHQLVFLTTGIYLCNYLVSLAMFKNMGDKLFKYWGTLSAGALLFYCYWI